MISRYLGPGTGFAITAVMASVLLPAAVWADGPGYTYLGASYEWTDVKYGVNPGVDENFNFGKFEGANIDASLGVLGFMHFNAQVFSGDCLNCGTDSSGAEFDQDFTAYKIGLGFNLGLDLIGLDENTDFVLRGNYIDIDMDSQTQGSIKDDGWSAEGLIRSQISENAEVLVGYEYHDVGTAKNSDVKVGLAYRVWGGLTLTTNAIVFDDDTGFDLGIRWYFGKLLFGDRDSIVR